MPALPTAAEAPPDDELRAHATTTEGCVVDSASLGMESDEFAYGTSGSGAGLPKCLLLTRKGAAKP